MTKLMAVIASTPGVGHYAALSGLNVVTNATNSNCGTIYCQLKSWDERSKASEQVPGIIHVMQQRIIDAGLPMLLSRLFSLHQFRAWARWSVSASR